MAEVRWGLLSTAAIGAVVVTATGVLAQLDIGLELTRRAETDAAAQARVLEAVLASAGRAEPVTPDG